MRWRRGDVAFGSLRVAAAVGASIFAVVALVGCATASLDQRRHHLVTVGLGAASLDDNQPIIQPDRLELHRSLVVHGAYDYRLMGPGGWLAVSARMVSYANRGTHAAPWRGASVSGEQVTRPCDLFWAIAGPSIGLQVPANLPMSLVGDVGYALAYLSRKGCSDSGRAVATAVIPQLGFGLLVGMSPEAAWKLGGRYVRLPLEVVGVGSEPRWASVGELSLVVAF